MADPDCSILIVDDEKINVAIFTAQLKDVAGKILSAYSGDQALGIIAEQPPDLILLDIMMPGMNGFEVASKLKGNPATSNIPIIIVSALNDRDSCMQALACGAEEFLTKPVQKAELLMRVRNLLKLKKYQDFLAAQSARLEKQVAADDLRLSEVQEQLFQSEKLASIGQLAAGIAHEINNPIGFVKSNLGRLRSYVNDFQETLRRYEAIEVLLPADNEALLNLQAFKTQSDLRFIRDDIEELLAQSQEGIARVEKIVLDLKNFARSDSHATWDMANLHNCLDSALTIANNEIKYRADIVKNLGVIPDIECIPAQIAQVFLNLLINAAQAMGDAAQRGTITVSSGCRGHELVWVDISDTGCGMTPEQLKRIFDPFYTTKAVGVGMGLGLSISHGIIARHGGNIEVQSTPGEGSSFCVVLPVRRVLSAEAPPG
jgi:two-component system NtrC family sensor kinase